MNSLLIAATMFGLLVLLELVRGQFRKSTATTNDRVVEVFNTLVVPMIVVPTILLTAYSLLVKFAPQYQGAWGQLPVWAMVAILLIGDDMSQYWWHRLSHAVPLLFNFHRAHHEGRYISVRVAYRNSILYYMFMPTLWISGSLIFLGLGEVFVVYLLFKALVIYGAHCAVPWDAFLYRHKALSPIAWVIERAISTPSTHHAHHGMNAEDGVTNYNGNYGNLLFFWDVLFGTARITRRYPTEFGLPGEQRATFLKQLFYPFFNDRKSTQ
jgi:sterol desaturase/sphingolipid hydroxylase (fatty acid hydroxylase superfamily)